MKKFFTILMSLFIASSAFAQYCGNSPNGITPDTNTTPGLTPPFESLPCITQGVYVSDTLYFTNFTAFAGMAVDSLTIDSIGNLPAGLCWNTSSPTNTFLGGQQGVILISGTTTAPAGQYTMGLYIQAWAGAIILPPNTNAETLAGLYYYLRVQCPNSLTCIPFDTINGKTTPFIADSTCLGSPTPPFSVTINPNQSATICAGQSITLVASTNSDSTVSYTWAADSTILTTDSIPVSPTVSTTYTVTATDDTGAIAIDSIYITVVQPPNALFTLQPTSTPHVWDILNQCTGTNTLYYVWSWGDGTTTATVYDTTSHTYDSAGYYTVCVYITDSVTGCTASYCDSSVYLFKDQSGQMVQINVKPIATGITPVIASAQQISYYGGAVHFSEAVTVPADVRLYDLSGREVMKRDAFTGNTLPLNGAISQGVYIISLRNNNYTISKKLTILQ